MRSSTLSARRRRRISSTMRPSARKTTRVGVARGDGVVGDHHDGLAEVAHRVAHERRGSRRRRRESRLPVGSSAKMISGRLARARATATRCCWPPDSSDGRCASRSREADGVDDRVEPLLVGLAAGEVDRQRDVLERGRASGIRLKAWNTKPMLVAPQQRELACRTACDSSTSPMKTCAGGERVEAGEAVHQRRLARARRAHDRGEVTAGELDGDAVERADLRCRRCRRP